MNPVRLGLRERGVRVGEAVISRTPVTSLGDASVGGINALRIHRKNGSVETHHMVMWKDHEWLL